MNYLRGLGALCGQVILELLDLAGMLLLPGMPLPLQHVHAPAQLTSQLQLCLGLHSTRIVNVIKLFAEVLPGRCRAECQMAGSNLHKK